MAYGHLGYNISKQLQVAFGEIQHLHYPGKTLLVWHKHHQKIRPLLKETCIENVFIAIGKKSDKENISLNHVLKKVGAEGEIWNETANRVSNLHKNSHTSNLGKTYRHTE